MGEGERAASGRYLGDLKLILDQEREIGDSDQHAVLEIALSVLRDQAFRGGASDRTVDLIRAVQVVVALQAMPVGTLPPQ